MYLTAGAAIREDALFAAGAGCCQGAAAAVLLLLLAAAAASTTAALLAFLRFVTFRTGMIILELATTTAVSTICAVSSPGKQPS